VHRLAKGRRGFALLLVLVVVAMLALSTYTFTSLMITENEGSLLAGQQLQARALVDSGVAHVRYFLELEPTFRQDLGGIYDNPHLFQAQLVSDLGTARSRARFGVVAPRLNDQGLLGGLRFGLQDESARLNLNALNLDISAGAQLDEAAANQNTQNGNGANGGGNGGGNGGDNGGGGNGGGNGGDNGGGGNGGGGGGEGGDGDGGDNGGGDGGGGDGDGSDEGSKLPDIDVSGRAMLMKLPGMTIEIADAILDWVDQDDEMREYGAEIEYYSALNPPYTPQNGPFKTIEELLLVRGVTADLLFGRDVNRNGMIDVQEMDLPLAVDADPGDGSMALGWSAYLTLYSQEKNVTSTGEPRIDVNADDMQQLFDDLSAVMDASWATFIVAYRQNGPYTGNSRETEPAGSQSLDLTRPGSTRLTQVLDLIGAKVEARLEGNEDTVIMESPFGDDPVSMSGYLSSLMDLITVNPAKTIPGRININQAPRLVLLAIPGMDEEMVDAIISQRDVQNSEFDEALQHESWLMSRGIVTLDEMRVLLPFITAGGDVYRAQIIGYFDQGETASRAEVVFDATTALPRILSWRDISHLGRGYAGETLGIALQDDDPLLQ
jgi:type II secretory pathway component PulK